MTRTDFRKIKLDNVTKELIQEEYDYQERKDSPELSRRQAATRMARSTASHEVFEALLQFGLTVDDKVVLQSFHAVTETALCLIQNGDLSVVDDIADIALQQTESTQRGTATCALERIADYDAALVEEYFELLIPALYDQTRPDYERSYLINILKHVENWEISPDLIRDIKEWACHPERWTGTSSLEMLAQRGLLQKDTHLLEQVLKLQKVGEQWDLMSNTIPIKSYPHIIGLLYSLDEKGFTPAICSLIKTLDTLTVPQVYEWLLFTHRATDRSPMPQAVRKALVQRIYEKQSSAISDTQVFQVLEELAPELLIDEDWSEAWTNWMDNSRIAFADAIGRANFEPAKMKATL